MKQLIDEIGRKIDYLRISITDRCNLRCRYCMPEEGINPRSHNDILRYEEIINIVRTAQQMGIKRVRITGGEPLVRPEVYLLVEKLAQLGLDDISMTTNGVQLAEKAVRLSEAGLDRVNISLDTLDQHKYQEITRRDNLKQVKMGIKKAIEADLNPVKINTVVMKGINDDEVGDFVDLTQEMALHVRFIEYMPLGGNDGTDRFCSLGNIKKRLNEEFDLTETKIKGNGPAEYFKIPESKGSIGFISPISSHFCSNCNRLRLTADGKIRPCLARDVEVKIPGNLTDEVIAQAFIRALECKPLGHSMDSPDFKHTAEDRNMYQIGG